jgi:hypothetical protein
MLERLKDMLGLRRTVEDVEADPHIARTRRTGGADTERHDSAGTTGTGDSGDFVGEVAGQDEGFTGETGAEARADRGDGVSAPGSGSSG